MDKNYTKVVGNDNLKSKAPPTTMYTFDGKIYCTMKRWQTVQLNKWYVLLFYMNM